MPVKFNAMADYAVWRGTVLKAVNVTGGPGRGKPAVPARRVLPDCDPGQDTIDRWRKKLCASPAGDFFVADIEFGFKFTLG